MKTPHVQAIVDKVEERFDGIRVGAWNCRPIAGTLTWSQHAYTEGEYEGNAADIFPWSPAQGDEIAAYIRTLPNVKVVLWKVKNHYDHVHFDTWPTGIGTPPCKGGSLRVRHEDGKIGRTFKEQDLPLNDEDKAWIKSTVATVVQAELDQKLGKTIPIPGEANRLTTQAIVNGFHAKTKPAEPGSKIYERIESTYQATKP